MVIVGRSIMTKIIYIMVIAVLSVIAIPSAMAFQHIGLSVTRDISDQTVVPGSTFAVTVTLTANDDIWVPALDEDLPDGWTVTDVDCAGVPYFYKASTSEWILLCEMSAGESRTITYDVTVPGDAALQDYDITGNAFAYHVDPVDVGGESTVTVEEYKALSVIRDISEQTVEQGSTFPVTVTLTANEDIWVPALDEDLPDGWTVTDVICPGATYKASTTEWIWLCLMPAGDSRTITYNVTVPADAALQDYEITGNTFAYGIDPINVSGESMVTVEEYKALSATRDISEQTVEQGSTFMVTLTLTANEDIYVPALDEDLPDGWIVTDVVCPGATYKESTTEWIWLCNMSAGNSTMITYNATVPADAALQDYEITGNTFAYGIDPVNISGEGMVTVIAGEVEATDHVVINEFVANPDSGNDWVELYNPTGSDISLDGWALNDSASQIKSLSGMINASEYRVFEVSKRLNKNDDIITLLDGTTVVDEVTYGSQPDNAPVPATGNSTGRCPNGGDTDNDEDDFRIFEIPTGGIENDCDYV